MQTLQQLKEGKLAGSVSLKLQENLSNFPQEIFLLKDTLELLDLSGNNLSTLPDNLDELRCLKILFCSENKFSHFPKVIGKCTNLDIIGFKANQIEDISEEAIPANLRWLILTNNKIKKLPKSIGNCGKLQKLMLAGNLLTELPENLANCSNLELIRLASNRLTAIPNWLLTLPKLSWLALSGNPFCQSSELKSITEIDWNEIELGSLLGSGASGLIYAATLKTRNLAIAVKIFKSEITSDGLPEDEMYHCLKAGIHKNLVPVLGKIANHPEQKEGLVLLLIPPTYSNLGAPPTFITCTRDVYNKPHKLPLQAVIGILAKMATLCTHLHQRGIMHGDFYAHNIMIDPDMEVVLGDFGAATSYNLDDPQATHFQKIEVRAFGCLMDDLINHFLAEPNEQLNLLRNQCLNKEIELRPSFEEIAKELSKLN